jgi:hypothetical protein
MRGALPDAVASALCRVEAPGETYVIDCKQLGPTSTIEADEALRQHVETLIRNLPDVQGSGTTPDDEGGRYWIEVAQTRRLEGRVRLRAGFLVVLAGGLDVGDVQDRAVLERVLASLD